MWLEARRALYLGIRRAKEEAWHFFLKDLERTNVYDVLKRIRCQPRSALPSFVDPETGSVETERMERGRTLGKYWFGASAVEVVADEGESGGLTGVEGDERGNKDSDNNNNNNEIRKNNNNNKKNRKTDDRTIDSVGSSRATDG